MRIGAVPIPANTLLGAGDYRFFVENSRARVVVADAMYQELIREAIRDFEEPVRIVFANGRVDGALAFEDLLEGGEDELSPAATHRDDPAFWLYSSGSTGRPKGAVHLHHDIIYTCETYARHVLEVSEDGQVLLGLQALPRLRARQQHLLPLLGRGLDGVVPGQADAGGDPGDHPALQADAFLLGADALQRYGQPPGGRGLRSLLDPAVRLGGGGIARAHLAPLEGDVRP